MTRVYREYVKKKQFAQAAHEAKSSRACKMILDRDDPFFWAFFRKLILFHYPRNIIRNYSTKECVNSVNERSKYIYIYIRPGSVYKLHP